MMTAPIRIRCEGSRTDGHRSGFRVMCPMCGQLFDQDNADPDCVIEHDRNDIIAMVERGDFG